jgi:hypothetical protein
MWLLTAGVTFENMADGDQVWLGIGDTVASPATMITDYCASNGNKSLTISLHCKLYSTEHYVLWVRHDNAAAKNISGTSRQIWYSGHRVPFQ